MAGFLAFSVRDARAMGIEARSVVLLVFGRTSDVPYGHARSHAL